MELFLLYIWLKLDTFQELLKGTIFASATVIVLVGLFLFLTDLEGLDDAPTASVKKWVKRASIVFFSGILLTVVTPTTKQTAILVAGYYAKEAVQSEEGKKVVTLLRRSVNSYLDEQLKQGAK